jgi:hypothetical protein
MTTFRQKGTYEPSICAGHSLLCPYEAMEERGTAECVIW